MKKTFLVLFVTLAISLVGVMSSCKNAASGGSYGAGTYTYSYQGTTYRTYTLNEDGTFKDQAGQTGTWTIEENWLTLDYKNGPTYVLEILGPGKVSQGTATF
ncbi:MAG: lipocalin family protein [Treponema sp.]|nr:lipocalin family protein [Treponema sp.]